jgi:hypothetical protein
VCSSLGRLDVDRRFPRLRHGVVVQRQQAAPHARPLRRYEHANKILNRHHWIVRERNPDAKFVLLEGNHEERIERILDAMPQFEGLLEVKKGLRLDERAIEWVRAWSKGETYRIGNATFTRGLYTIMYHAKKMVDAWGESIFYGHTHDMVNSKCIARHPEVRSK